MCVYCVRVCGCVLCVCVGVYCVCVWVCIVCVCLSHFVHCHKWSNKALDWLNRQPTVIRIIFLITQRTPPRCTIYVRVAIIFCTDFSNLRTARPVDIGLYYLLPIVCGSYLFINVLKSHVSSKHREYLS